jgi:thiosulfate/3-mercaptopyruvate sulfurtransferase
MNPLISSEELANRLGDVRLHDIRWSLTEPNHGRSTYEAGHIPGAVFVDLDADLSAPPGTGRHPLPTVDTFTETLGRLGVTPGEEVVVYDDMGGVIAARMWWMLQSIGHTRSRLLDGGYQTWTSMRMPSESGSNTPEAAEYATPATFEGVVTHDRLKGRVIVDARALERYTGETEPVDPKAGHIPGAISKPTSGNLGADGRFLQPEFLRARFSDVDAEPVMSCGSGVTACHNALAMVVAGYEMPAIYIGSFSEWSQLDKPVAVGNQP